MSCSSCRRTSLCPLEWLTVTDEQEKGLSQSVRRRSGLQGGLACVETSHSMNSLICQLNIRLFISSKLLLAGGENRLFNSRTPSRAAATHHSGHVYCILSGNLWVVAPWGLFIFCNLKCTHGGYFIVHSSSFSLNIFKLRPKNPEISVMNRKYNSGCKFIEFKRDTVSVVTTMCWKLSEKLTLNVWTELFSL